MKKTKIKWTNYLTAMLLALASGISFTEGAPFLVTFVLAYLSGYLGANSTERVGSSQYLTVTEIADK